MDALRRWAESGSLWPLPFGTACCAIEFMAVASPRYDIARFGSEVLRFSPRQADVLLVMGTITDKMAPIMQTVYEQMAEPKWVISMGACATSGGFYRSYNVMQGIDEAIPVDVYIPGCSPTPEAILRAIMLLEEKIRAGGDRWPQAPVGRPLHGRLADASVTRLDPPSSELIAYATARAFARGDLADALRARLGDALTASSDFRGDLSLTVRPQSVVDVCTALRDEPAWRMDMLMDVCAVDYLVRRPRFDVVYHLASMATGRRLRIHAPVDGERPEIDSVSGVWQGANWFEREAYDLFGVRFRHHPDLRRILTHAGFGDAHPMRRDYAPGLRQPFARGSVLPEAERSPKGEVPPLEIQPLILNIGPSHPAMHGTFRLVAQLDGETVREGDVELGYLHRNFEKMAEAHTYWQTIPYCDRLNYVSPMMNSTGFAMAVEKLLDVEIPARAQTVRLVLCELSRVMDHAVCVGTNLLDMGVQSDFFYLWTLREMIYDLLEECCGARLNVSYVRIGGLAEDVPEDFVARVRQILAYGPKVIDDTDRMITRNAIARSRMKGIGAVAKGEAVAWGFTGPVLRASGVPYDVRKAHPYYGYDALEFDIPVGARGDVFDRYLVRMEEMRQSLRIVAQAIEALPEGAVIVGDRRVALPPKHGVYTNIEDLMNHFKLIMEGIRAPAGEVYGFSEAANGELGFYIVSDGGQRPYRVKVRPPSFAIYQAFPQMVRGMMVSDVVAAIGSLNIVAGELDR